MSFHASHPRLARELWRLLRPPAATPSAVSVDGSGSMGDLQEEDEGTTAAEKAGHGTRKVQGRKGDQRAAEAGELVAAQLNEALQVGTGTHPPGLSRACRACGKL